MSFPNVFQCLSIKSIKIVGNDNNGAWPGFDLVNVCTNSNAVINESDKHFQEVKGEAKNCAMGNDPVNLSTGNFIQKGTDIKIPTLGQPLEFTRFYNSLDQNTGPLGKGWTHNYNTRLAFNGDGSVAVSYADGHVLYFQYDGTGYITPSG